MKNLEQMQTDLQYLRHTLLNGTATIEGCMRQIEECLKGMNTAVKACRTDLECLMTEDKNV